jgi:hypothetical protein
MSPKFARKIIFFPSYFLLLLDPGAEIRYGDESESGIKIPDPQHW